MKKIQPTTGQVKNLCSYFAALAAVATLAACHTVSNVQRTDVSGEGTAVFVRPDSFSVFGTKSARDYIEIVYEKAERDDNGFVKLSVGVRNRGGTHFWDDKAPTVRLGAEAAFYKTRGPDSAPLWKSNRKAISLQRGETTHLVFDCPAKGAMVWQVVFSDY